MEKAVKLLLSLANATNSSDITVRLLPRMLAASWQDLSLIRMIAESESARTESLFRCMDKGTSQSSLAVFT